LVSFSCFCCFFFFNSFGGPFFTSMAQGAIPKMAGFVNRKSFSALNKLLFKMMIGGGGIGIILTIFLYFFGEGVLTLLYTKEYAQYKDVLIVILLGTTVTFSYIFIGTALTCIRKQWVKLPISIASFLLLFGLIHFSKLEGMIDVSFIVLYVEIFSFFVYFVLYFIFIKNIQHD